MRSFVPLVFFLGVGLALLMPDHDARAAKLAQIDIETVDAKAGPGEEHQVLFTLKKRQWVSSSNLPTNGFYKVRTAAGEIGWVSTEAIAQKQPARVPTGAEQPQSDGTKQPRPRR